jgi:hypothetical protein
MRSPFKITLALLVCAMCLYVSCKKSETVPAENKPVVNTADISKQIASSLYRSISDGLSTSDGLKTNGAQGGLVTMDNNHGCGEVITTPTNKTIVSGDTTRNYTGNSIFTYMCNGYFNNGYNIDAYTLSDTLKTTETGSGFANSYYLTLNYVVKATDANYAYITIGGTTTTSSHLSKIKGGVTTGYHDFSTVYKLNDIVAKRTGAINPVNVLGRVDFNTTTADQDATTNPAGSTAAYSGYILFLPDNTAKLYFQNPDGSYKVYLDNLLTGEITAV